MLSEQEAEKVASIVAQFIDIVNYCESEPLVKQYLKDLSEMFASGFDKKYDKVAIDPDAVLDAIEIIERLI